MNVTASGCDVTEESQVDALVDRVMSENGRLDIAICNAGGSFITSCLPDGDIDEFRKTLEINLTGTYITAQSAGRAMIPAKNGAIITLGSIASTLAMDTRNYNSEFKRSGRDFPQHDPASTYRAVTRSQRNSHTPRPAPPMPAHGSQVRSSELTAASLSGEAQPRFLLDNCHGLIGDHQLVEGRDANRQIDPEYRHVELDSVLLASG